MRKLFLRKINMKKFINVKGIIFDYGGTIDTNGKHWAEVLWEKYTQLGIPVSKNDFKEAYISGERTLALTPLIAPEHNFYDVLLIKSSLQLEFLVDKKKMKKEDVVNHNYVEKIAEECYSYVQSTVRVSRGVLEKLSKQHKLILVSNFYGNIETILKDFNLLCYFNEIIESSVVGVRKPDPAIFQLGVSAMGCEPEEIVVVGDSFSKDIVPAKKIGCKAVWLKGIGWEEETDDSLPDAIITDLTLLPDYF